MNRDYLTLSEVLCLHQELIALFGGTLGLRDQGALEAAITRPQMGYYQNLTEEAASLMESLGMNHPFLDGNKRIAFFSTDSFLRMNGYYLDCDNQTAHQEIIQMLESRTFNFQHLAIWLTAYMKPLVTSD